MAVKITASRPAYLNFRHPATGVVVLVHPLEVGLANIYVRHGWGLLLKTENIFGPTDG